MYSDNNNQINIENNNLDQGQINNTMNYYNNVINKEQKQLIKPPKNSNIGLIIGLTFIIILTIFIVKLLINKSYNSDKENNNNISENDIVNIEVSENYIERQIQYRLDVRYKLTNPTFLWDCNDDFWTAEIDTVLLPSKNGEIIENYYDIENMSGVYFQVRDDVVESETKLRIKYKDWLKINNLQVNDIDDDEFSRHIKGETESIYFESYCFSYEYLHEDGDISTINYSIELLLYKDNYDSNFVKNIINEYHTIIDTFEFVK